MKIIYAILNLSCRKWIRIVKHFSSLMIREFGSPLPVGLGGGHPLELIQEKGITIHLFGGIYVPKISLYRFLSPFLIKLE